MLSSSWDYSKAMTKKDLLMQTGTCYLPDDIGNATNKCILGLKNPSTSYLVDNYIYYKANVDLVDPDSQYTIYVPLVLQDTDECIFDLTFINTFTCGDNYDFISLNIHFCVFDPRNPGGASLNLYRSMDDSDYTYTLRISADTIIRSLHISGLLYGSDGYSLDYNYYASDGAVNGGMAL